MKRAILKNNKLRSGPMSCSHGHMGGRFNFNLKKCTGIYSGFALNDKHVTVDQLNELNCSLVIVTMVINK